MARPLTKLGERFEQSWRDRGFENRSDFIRAAIKEAPPEDKPNLQTVNRWIRGESAATLRKIKPFAAALGRDANEYFAWLHEGEGPQADIDAAFAALNATQEERIDARAIAPDRPTKREIIGIVKALRAERDKWTNRIAARDAVIDRADAAAAAKARRRKRRP